MSDYCELIPGADDDVPSEVESAPGTGLSSPEIMSPCSPRPGSTPRTLSYRKLLAAYKQAGWFIMPKIHSSEWQSYQQTGLLQCTDCGRQLVVAKTEHVLRHATVHDTPDSVTQIAPVSDPAAGRAVSVLFTLAGVSYRSQEMLRAHGLQNLLKHGPPLASRKFAAKNVREFAEKDLPGLLRQVVADSPCVLAIDESTAFWQGMEKAPRVTALVCVNLETGEDCCLLVEATEKCNADTIVEHVRTLIRTHTLCAAQLVGIVCDNASYMTSALSKLQSFTNLKHLLHLRCTAHTLSLQVRNILDSVKALQPLLSSIGSLWSRGGAARAAMDGVVGSPVTRGNDTRWAYYLEALDHMMEATGTFPHLPGDVPTPRLRWHDLKATLEKMKDADMSSTASQVLAKLKNHRLLLAAKTISLLCDGFAAVFTSVQSRGEANPAAWPAREVLTKFAKLSDPTPQPMLQRVVRDAAEALGWERSSEGDYVLEARVLVMQSQRQQLLTQLQEGLHRCRESIGRNFTGTIKQIAQLKQALDPHIRGGIAASRANKAVLVQPEVLAQGHSVQELKDQFVSYCNGEFAERRPEQSLLDYWCKLAPVCPALAAYAQRVLRLPLSSASVERVFSAMAEMESHKTRTQLQPDGFLAELMVKANRSITTQHVLQASHNLTAARKPKKQASISAMFGAGVKRGRSE